jgi:hypothetical protein
MSTETEAVPYPTLGETTRTPASAARSLALYITGEPKLAADTLSRYVGIVRGGFDSGAYSEDDWRAALGLESGNPLGVHVLRILDDRASENDVVLESSKQLESVLRERYQAQGRGLHEYVTSVGSRIPDRLVGTLRYLATVRNGVVHGDGELKDVHERARYALQAGRAYDWLVKLANADGNTVSGRKAGILRKLQLFASFFTSLLLVAVLRIPGILVILDGVVWLGSLLVALQILFYFGLHLNSKEK